MPAGMPTTAPIRHPIPTEPSAHPTSAPIATAAAVTPMRIPPAPAGSNVWREPGSIRGEHSKLVTPRNGLRTRISADFVCSWRARRDGRLRTSRRPRARQRRQRLEHVVGAAAARGALHARRPGPARNAAEPARGARRLRGAGAARRGAPGGRRAPRRPLLRRRHLALRGGAPALRRPLAGADRAAGFRHRARRSRRRGPRGGAPCALGAGLLDGAVGLPERVLEADHRPPHPSDHGASARHRAGRADADGRAPPVGGRSAARGARAGAVPEARRVGRTQRGLRSRLRCARRAPRRRAGDAPRGRAQRPAGARLQRPAGPLSRNGRGAADVEEAMVLAAAVVLAVPAPRVEGPRTTTSDHPVYRFAAPRAVGFRCSFDSPRLHRCGARYSEGLTVARHVLRVRAVGRGGRLSKLVSVAVRVRAPRIPPTLVAARPIPVPPQPGVPALAAGSVWGPSTASGTVVRVDPSTRALTTI